MLNIRRLTIVPALASFLLLGGCTHHTVEIKPIKIEPIYAKIDVTIREEVKQDLDNVFDFKDAAPGDASGQKEGAE